MKPSERQGHELSAQAEKKLKKMFGDKDEAKELYEKAAVQFKLAKLQPKPQPACAAREVWARTTAAPTPTAQ